MDQIVIGLGIICGLAFAGIAVFLWMSFAGPLQEWICERFLDPLHKTEVSPPPAREGKKRIVFSDIHIDTWDYPDSPREKAFLEFLTWIRRDDSVCEVYLNGDLMDMPLHPLNFPNEPITIRMNDATDWDGVIPQKYFPVLGALADLSNRQPSLNFYYLTGNHDIGIQGARYVRPWLKPFATQGIWDPSMLLEHDPDHWVYIEHGHLWDPFIWLYLRYAALDLTRDGTSARNDIASKVMQRGGQVGMRQDRRPLETMTALAVPPSPEKEGFFTKLSRYRYRQAARRCFRRARRDFGYRVQTVIFGHTHIPDRYVFPGGLTYLNSGDWAGNSPNQTYLVVYPNGTVTGPHQWPPET